MKDTVTVDPLVQRLSFSEDATACEAADATEATLSELATTSGDRVPSPSCWPSSELSRPLASKLPSVAARWK